MSRPREELYGVQQDVERLANRIPEAGSKDEALEIAIKAAEMSFKALKLASTPDEKTACRTRAEQLMRDAELIKRSSDWREAFPKANPTELEVAPSEVKVLKEPTSTRKLPTREQLIVLRAGFLNGTKFPPWTNDPSPEEFDLKDGEALFLDESSELPLSDFQLDVLDDWKRPKDALPPPAWFAGVGSNLAPSMSFQQDIDLVQDAATDCSVVASLCAGVARSKRGHPKMLQKVMHPYDVTNGRPQISKNGKYIVKMNFNGCYRKVTIDDRIPTSENHRVIHVVDRNNPALLWPILIEKAYLKVRGGYDFPGSNSGTDLWILTGWIPEQVFLQSDELEPDRFWKRIMNGFAYGDVLITMGTGKTSRNTEKELGLAGEHDYAVLELREVDGQRLMLIKNPWVEGTSWRGRFKTNTDKSVPVTIEEEAVNSPRDLLNGEELTPGTFWMDLDNVIQHFESIYLNWNIGLFKQRQDIHFEWDLSESTGENGLNKTRGPTASLQHNPQFTISTSKGGSIWLLLWRHFQNSVPEDATAEEIESGRHFIDLNGHITLAVFSSNGKRVMVGERYVQKGWFVDSPQTLLQLEDCEPDKLYTAVPLEQGLPSNKHTFTISTFSNSTISLSEAASRFAYATQVKGSWTKYSAGGNAQQSTYCDNPQYTLKVPVKSSVSLLLETSNPLVNVHVKLLHSDGQRVYRIQNKDIIVDSKDYRSCCCLAEIEDLLPGQYTVVVSTFDAKQLGDFNLLIQSSAPVSATLLPREGADRIRITLRPLIFQSSEIKLAAPINPLRLVNFYAIARQTHPRTHDQSHIRISIELGRGPTRRILAVSNDGEYLDSVAGAVRSESCDLATDFRKYGLGEAWIVVDRMGVSEEGVEERFEVDILVDQPQGLEIGEWRTRED